LPSHGGWRPARRSERATDVEWREGVLIVRARTPAWLKELRHARPILTARVRELVGR
jgi:predicted nucleic acid-binding Zn ribbon protein